MKKEIILFIILLIIFMFLILTQEPSESKELVTNRTITSHSNIFFNYKIIKYPTKVEITQPNEENLDVGIVTDPWNLIFGSVPGNGSFVKRYVGITNINEKNNKIKLKAYGSITPLINFSKNDFELKENESIVIEVDMNTTYATFGNYSGEIDVIIKTPRYDFLKILM